MAPLRRTVTAELVPLREHIEALMSQMDLRYQQRFDAQTKAIDAALEAAEKAVSKAESANEKRFESVNEFRQTLSDQAATFINNDQFETLRQSIAALNTRLDRIEGRSTGLNAGWVYLGGAVTLLLGFAALYGLLK